MESQIIRISSKEAQTLVKSEFPQIIDVRTLDEFNEGHLADAKNIDFLSDTFFNDIQKLDKEKPVLVYCYSGKRSANSALIFKKSGFTKIYDLEGGIVGWQSNHLEIEN